ncbi:MAG: GTP-binding protein HflX [Candidatus Azotimanducaceae bacterium]
MFFERPEAGTRALLIHIELDDGTEAELRDLALSAGLEPVGALTAKRKFPDPKTYIGKGKLEEICAYAEEIEAELILFDQELSPSQERNLEAALERRVLGRTGLILHIFAQRARTHEGKLQVELAQLQHSSTRLVRGWTHLDRQQGGSGSGAGASMGVTGAGETQLESDQRMLAARFKNINKRLARVKKQRSQNRRSRQKAEIKTVSLVGYTNAGKSTLFNAMCQSDVHAADQLFATLDPTLRQLDLPVIGRAILTDTVGFIRKLPHGLVNAFRATLEEVMQADLLLHVVDSSTSDRPIQMQEVNAVLDEIGAEAVPQLLVYNKIDLIEGKPRIDRDEEGKPVRVWVSALGAEGMDLLATAISEILSHQVVDMTLKLNPNQGQLRAKLFELGAVVNEDVGEDGTISMQVKIEAESLRRLASQTGMDIASLDLPEIAVNSSQDSYSPI